MTKTMKKVLSVLLAMTVIFSIPVFASVADDDRFDFTYDLVETVSGDKDSKYIERIKVTLGTSAKLIGNDVVITVGTNSNADNWFSLKKSDISVKTNDSKNETYIEFNINKKVEHKTEVNIYIKEGTFQNKLGKVNSGYTVNTSGNVMIDTIYQELTGNPLGRLVQKMENSEYHWLLIPIIAILKWFMNL